MIERVGRLDAVARRVVCVDDPTGVRKCGREQNGPAGHTRSGSLAHHICDNCPIPYRIVLIKRRAAQRIGSRDHAVEPIIAKF